MRLIFWLGLAGSLLFQIAWATAWANEPVEFVFRISSDSKSLDWGLAEVNTLIVDQIMEGLTSVAQDGRVEPALAASWSQNHNNIKFYLRKNLRWSDGKKLCADDFVYAWQRVLEPTNHAPYSHLIKSSVAQVKAKRCDVLEVTLKNPIRYFPELVSHHVFFPYRAIKPTNEVVTVGPYVVKTHKPNEAILLEKNKYYYNAAKILPQRLKAVVVEDDATALRLFEQQKIDWLKDVPFLAKSQLRHTQMLTEQQTLVSYFLAFELDRVDRNLRCALLKSLNTAEIPELLHGHEEVAHSLVPFSLKRFNQGAYFNPVEARQLLQQVKNNEKIILSYYNKDIHTPLVEWAQNQWKKNLNLTVELSKVDSKSYWSNLTQKKYGFFLSGTTAAFAHPTALLAEFTSNSLANYGHYQSTRYDQLVDQLSSAGSVVKKIQLIQQAEAELIEKNCAVIPLYFRTTSYLLNKRWKNFTMNALAHSYFKNLQFASQNK